MHIYMTIIYMPWFAVRSFITMMMPGDRCLYSTTVGNSHTTTHIPTHIHMPH